MQIVFVVSPDWTLRTAVRAELREAGVEALGMETADDVGIALSRGTLPSAVVIDAAQLETQPTREAIANLAHRLPVLVVDSRVTPGPEIPGAERLARPISVGDIVARVRTLLQERPSGRRRAQIPEG
jgi:DNA-binding response OmpR family regulator